MLRFVAMAAPDGLPRRSFNQCAVSAHVLAQTFHFKLLQPHHHGAQSLVVGQEAMLLNAQTRRIPVGDKREQQRQVFTGRRLCHMHVHGMRAVEQGTERVRTERHGICQTNGRPHREAAAHPLPNRKEVFFRQIHVTSRIFVGRNHHHMTRAILS